MLSGGVRTTGLKQAKPAFVQPRGTGYTTDRPKRSVNVVDHSVNMSRPSFRSNLSSNFSTAIPAKYRDRISNDRKLSRLL